MKFGTDVHIVPNVTLNFSEVKVKVQGQNSYTMKTFQLGNPMEVTLA